jgi:transcription initiation factor TFIIIB Brf1 subunit/transcription initiation factor TFIIB
MFLNQEFCQESDFDVFKDSKTFNPNLCIECKSKAIEEKDGYLVCSNCGVNFNELILDRKLEIMNDDTKGSARSNFQINSLTPYGSMGTKLCGKNLSIFQKKNHLWSSGTNHKEISNMNNFKKIDLYCNKGKIPLAVSDYAKKLFMGINKEKKFRGMNHLGIIGACIYYGCKRRNIKLDIEDISKVVNVHQKYITKGITIIGKFIYNNKVYYEELLSQKSISEKCLTIADKLSEYNSETYRKKLIEVTKGINETDLELAIGYVYYVYQLLQESSKKRNALLVKLEELSKMNKGEILEVVKALN